MGDDNERNGSTVDGQTTPMASDVQSAQLRARYQALLDGKRSATLVVYHRDGATAVALEPEGALTIGRGVAADITVRDPSLSRVHARFWREGGDVFVADLGSTNGTFVGEQRVGDRTALVADGHASLGSVLVALRRGVSDAARFGLAGHDALEEQLAREIARCRHTRRQLALLMLAPTADASLERLTPAVNDALRSFDRAALYARDTIEILQPESDAERAGALATRLATIDGAKMRVGWALFPSSATSAAELLAVARGALRQAQPGVPAAAPARGSGEPRSSAGPDSAPIVSAATGALYRLVERVAGSTIPVLIRGETGSGKEVIARAIHQRGPRARGPLCSVNCGAIAEGLVEGTLFGHERGAFTGAAQARAGVFEAADGGIVFLDEVGELPPSAQVALLRVLETKQVVRVGATAGRDVDIRVVAATHRDLEAMSEAGGFRWDLYYRLAGITLEVPPLRERREEILPLAQRFLAAACEGGAAPVLDAPAAELLERYPWPGNVRELKNAIERAVVIAEADRIGVDDLPRKVRALASEAGTEAAARSEAPVVSAALAAATPPAVSAPVELDVGVDLKQQVQQYEIALIRNALERADWNAKQAAEALGLPLRTLHHKMKTHGLRKPTDS